MNYSVLIMKDFWVLDEPHVLFISTGAQNENYP